MTKSIETTVGNGNRYSDLSFLWFPTGDLAPAQGRSGHESLHDGIGLQLADFVPVTAGEDALRTLFRRGLVDGAPATTSLDVAGMVADLSAALDSPAARRRFATAFSTWLTAGPGLPVEQLLQAHDDEFATRSLADIERNLDAAFTTPVIVVERSPPSLESIGGLLSRGSGVALGAYVGLAASTHLSPLLLYASVPAGMLVCGTAAGIADALQRGLRHRMLAWLVGATQRQRRTAVDHLLSTLMQDSVGTPPVFHDDSAPDRKDKPSAGTG